jgi:hypothetical protein
VSVSPGRSGFGGSGRTLSRHPESLPYMRRGSCLIAFPQYHLQSVGRRRRCTHREDG